MYTFLARCIFRVLAVGPLPEHIAFIMDGNRRYAKKKNLDEKAGYRAGFLALMFILKQCYELGVRYITIYSFSIDNFNRSPEDVKSLMELMQEKVVGFLEYKDMIQKYGIRVHFLGNLALLSDSLRAAAEEAMKATSMNSTTILLICVAYNSTDEILHAVENSCRSKLNEGLTLGANQVYSKETNEVLDLSEGEDEIQPLIKVADIEKHLYMSVAPDPDILIRTSGETRLSHFLLWQTQNCLLYNPDALWPEISLRHLVVAVLKYQRHYYYLEKKKKQS